MPSEKFKISKASRSIRHAAQNFFGTFSASPNGPQSTSTSFPIVGGNITASIHEDPESHMDRRSAHNALERQRRETLNSKFQELAHALPALQTVRRPSKTMIVAKSLDYVTKSIQRENHYVNQIKELRKQNERLRKQAKISKLASNHKHQFTKKNATLSTCTTSTTSTEGPPPMTPPLSSSSNVSSCTMKRSSTVSSNNNNSSTVPSSPMMDMNASHQHYQMSPPLTPETPNKKQRTMSPLMESTTWVDPSMMLMNTMTVSTTNTTHTPPPHHGNNMMMMPPQQWSPQGSDPMFSTSSLDSYSTNNIIYNNQPPIPPHSSAIIQDPSQYMSIPDPSMNPMLFSSYQWQDTPPVYHPPAAKSSDMLYLA